MTTEDFREKFKHAFFELKGDNYKPVEIVPVPKMQHGVTYILHL
jgi:hypothetical protein